MANAVKLTFLLFLIFFLMSNARGNKPATEEGIVHGNGVSGGAPYSFVSHEKKGVGREEG